jgi:hypothetical protein
MWTLRNAKDFRRSIECAKREWRGFASNEWLIVKTRSRDAAVVETKWLSLSKDR